MEIRVELHARAADLAGTREVVAVVEERATCADVKRALAALHPELEGVVGSSVLASDRDYLSDGVPLVDGARLHLIPPVSGG